LATRKIPAIGSPAYKVETARYIASDKAGKTARAKELGMTYRSYCNAMQGCRQFVEADKPEPLEVAPIPEISIIPLDLNMDKDREDEQVALFSDSQIGQKTISYDSEVFKARSDQWFDMVVHIGESHRSFANVSKINVEFLGDILENEAIGYMMTLDELELIVFRQLYDVAYPVISNLLINLTRYYDQVDCHCVRGNHGKLGKFGSVVSNWDTMLYKTLAIGLQKQRRINFYIETDKFWQTVEVKGHTMLNVHGDKIPTHLGIPYFGIDRRVARWNINIPSKFEWVNMGHFHVCNYVQPSGIPIFINGCWPSDTDFPLQVMGLNTPPAQWTYFVSEKHGAADLHIVRLDK